MIMIHSRWARIIGRVNLSEFSYIKSDGEYVPSTFSKNMNEMDISSLCTAFKVERYTHGTYFKSDGLSKFKKENFYSRILAKT